MMPEVNLRPLERRILSLDAAGCETIDIANRFRRSPGFIRRVIDMANMPGRNAPPSTSPVGLRPIERRVLKWIDSGADIPNIAARFRRTPQYIRRVEELAALRESLTSSSQ